METIKYTGKLQRYFRAPIYMIILFVAGDVLVYLQNIKAGALVSVCIIIYAAIVLWYYRTCAARLNEEIIHFATHYGTVQKELLNKFQIPYALMDYTGKVLWVNEEFARVTAGTSITTSPLLLSLRRSPVRRSRKRSITIFTWNWNLATASMRQICSACNSMRPRGGCHGDHDRGRQFQFSDRTSPV